MGKIIAGIVVLVIIIGGVMYFMNSGSSATPTTASTEVPAASSTSDQAAGTTTADTSTSSGSGTIASLMAMTGSVQCTVNVAGTNPASGTVYMSGGKMHGDFTTTMQGKTMHAYMINDGTYTYSWSDMVAEGVKIPTAQAATSPQAAAQGFSPSTNVSYNCSPWTADPSQFVPPTSISFMAVAGTK